MLKVCQSTVSMSTVTLKFSMLRFSHLPGKRNRNSKKTSQISRKHMSENVGKYVSSQNNLHFTVFLSSDSHMD